MDYSMNMTFICIGKSKKLCHLFYCDIWFAAVAWNGTCNAYEVCLLVSGVSGMILTMASAVLLTTAFAT